MAVKRKIMKDQFICNQEIQKELIEIEHVGTNLIQKLTLLSQKIKYIFSKIKSFDNVESAHDYFNTLELIESTLTALIYKENLGLPDALMQLTYDFDRIDDKNLREYIFNKIKTGDYYFGKKLGE